MSVLTEVFAQARAVLAVTKAADKATIKRAYRKKVIEHAPDQDPEGFQRVRAAYEVLSNPFPTAKERLFHQLPHVPPPQIPQPQPPVEAVVLALLRQVVGRLPAADLLGPLCTPKPRKPSSP